MTERRKIEIYNGERGFCVDRMTKDGLFRYYFSTIEEVCDWIIEAFSEPREPVTNPEKKET